jgi:hypothetical protein
LIWLQKLLEAVVFESVTAFRSVIYVPGMAPAMNNVVMQAISRHCIRAVIFPSGTHCRSGDQLTAIRVASLFCLLRKVPIA